MWIMTGMVIFITSNKMCYNEITKLIYSSQKKKIKLICKFGCDLNIIIKFNIFFNTYIYIYINLRSILENILLIQLYFLKNNYFFYLF